MSVDSRLHAWPKHGSCFKRDTEVLGDTHSREIYYQDEVSEGPSYILMEEMDKQGYVTGTLEFLSNVAQ